MKLDVDAVREAGMEVLAKRDEIVADQTPHSFVEVQSGLIGLSITEALAAAMHGYQEFQGRFSGELDYLGNAVIVAGDVVEATDEQGKAMFDALDVPA